MKLSITRRRALLTFALLLIASLALAGCGSPNEHVDAGYDGFWDGLWDGMTAGFAFVGNLFGGHYGVYETDNNGNWYDFGFLLGAGVLFGGGGGAASR
jgi:hypothetical protein